MLEILKKYFFHKEKILMSILEKLKNLVATIEDNNGGETTEIEEEAIQQQVASLLSKEEEQQPEEEIEKFPDYLQCSQEETDLIRSYFTREKAIKVSLAEKVLEFEKVKQLAASKLLEVRQEMIDSLNNLRLEYGVPDEGYSVQLPSSPEDKVSFKRD
tara:strand:+ start:76 stop:549 length:474 start_codon:yes stop_codon:yes gene_type:complete